jgi:hypothetical protein
MYRFWGLALFAKLSISNSSATLVHLQMMIRNFCFVSCHVSGYQIQANDVMHKNVPIFKAQASALEQHAAPDCKVKICQELAPVNLLSL